MQTLLTSRTPSFSPIGRGKCSGFTLVELLVSIAVIVIITSIVLVKYDSFDSTTLLKNTAYDIALTLREAQLKSVSASRQNGNFDYPFGVTFTPGAKTYTTFRYQYVVATDYPYYDGTHTSDLNTATIDRSMYVSDMCVEKNGTYYCSSTNEITRLDISFKRPEFKALIYADGYSAGAQEDISSAKIKVASTRGTGDVFIVTVTHLGQIMVCLEDKNNLNECL